MFASDQLEGGEEIRQAAYLAGETARPITGTASKGAALFRRKAIEAKKKKIKKVDAGEKLAKDLISRRVMLWVKTAAPVVGLALLLLVLLVAMAAVPVVAVVGVAYNSPFAIFLLPLEDGDTVTTVASAYVAEFNREVTTLANDRKVVLTVMLQLKA